MDNPSKVETGKAVREFPGRSFNALVDDLNFRRAHGTTADDAGAAKATAQIIVGVHNGVSEDLQPGDVLGFEDPQFEPTTDAPDPAYRWPAVKGVTPDATDHKNQFVILSDGITQDTIGRAVLLGLAWARVNWTDAAHDHVKLTTGETQLQSAASGIKPVWYGEIPDPEYLPADVWALISLGVTASDIRKAKVTTAIAAAATTAAADWGDGEADLCDEITGLPAGDPIAVKNEWPIGFPENAVVFLNMAYSTPRVITGTCGAEADYWTVE